MLYFVLPALCLLFGIVNADCPHTATNLTSFASLYPSPTTTTDVSITTETLLDVSILDVNTIVISGSGKLVFEPGHEISIRTRGIRIKDDGELIIGSSDCRFEDEVEIALHGSRTVDRSTVSDRGEKFITVEDKGSLKIYGKDKLPWTKLSSTLNMSTPIYRHVDDPDVSDKHKNKEGLALTIFDSSLTRTTYVVRDFWKDNTASEQSEVNKMVNNLNDVTDGQVVAIALQNFRKFTAALDLTVLFSTVESVAGMPNNSLAFRNTEKYDAFALVFEKGGSYAQSVDKHYGKAKMEARASIEAYGKKVSSVSIITAESKSDSFVDVLIHSMADAYPVLNLVHDVTNTADPWEIGDQIMITSTDYHWKHAEVRTITEFLSPNSVKLDYENYYRHYGAIENGVDMRAEVALMTRNIKIHGELSPGGCPAENENCDNFVYDSYGCHIKVIHNFTAVHVEGVEIYHCGQPTDKGFYPLHFHMCEDVTDREAVLKRNSLHDTFQRAITIHGTYGTSEALPGVEVIENTAINVLGHAYFEEDGAERATVFRGNLAASVRKVNNGFFSTDKNKPTGFWFVNPETVSIDNVAAGGEGFGIWYTFPKEPVGPSAGIDMYGYREPSYTALYTTDNNVAHSNDEGGLNFDNFLENEHGDVTGCMRYDPRKNTTDDTSPIDQVFIYRMTAYKNRKINIWVRGGGFYIMQASLAESKRGIQFASGGPQHQYISHSVIMGESEGNNEDIEGYPDAFGKSSNGAEDFNHYLGIVFYDGPIWISDIFFTGFKSKEDNQIVAGALGFQPKNKFDSSVVSSTKNLQFDGVDAADINRVFDGDKEEDSINGFGDFEGDEVATFRDLDGSVVACDSSSLSGPYQVYKPEKFLMTERSFYRENWKIAYSTDMYSKLYINVLSPNSADFDQRSQMRRVNRLDATDTVYDTCDDQDNKEFMAVLNRTDKYIYDFQFIAEFPEEFHIRGKGIERGQNVIVGMCLPENTTKDDIEITLANTGNGPVYKSTQANGIVWVNDFDALADDTTMSRVMLKDRFLYAHFTSRYERDPAWDKFDDNMCPGGTCPKFQIKMKNGQPTSYEPCFNPTEAELNAEGDISNVETCTLPSGTRDNSWGAGDTFASKNGGFRDWTSWSDCCNVDASSPMQRFRKRTCNFPIPYGPSGESCSGPTNETEDCPTPCQVGEQGLNSA